MTALANAKHERFAQLIFQGRTADQAYAEVGYKPNRQNAARLTTNDDIRTRLTELQAHSSMRAEISVAGITDRLLSIAAKGEKSGDAPMLAVARASLMDAAKLNGLVVDKADMQAKVLVSRGPDLSSLSEEQLRVLAALPFG